jgi:hypothetical protein
VFVCMCLSVYSELLSGNPEVKHYPNQYNNESTLSFIPVYLHYTGSSSGDSRSYHLLSTEYKKSDAYKNKEQFCSSV